MALNALISGFVEQQDRKIKHAQEAANQQFKQSELLLKRQQAEADARETQQRLEYEKQRVAVSEAAQKATESNQKKQREQEDLKIDQNKINEVGKNNRAAIRALVQKGSLDLRDKEHLEKIQTGFQKTYELQGVPQAESIRRAKADIEALRYGVPDESMDYLPLIQSLGNVQPKEGQQPSLPTAPAPGAGQTKPSFMDALPQIFEKYGLGDERGNVLPKVQQQMQQMKANEVNAIARTKALEAAQPYVAALKQSQIVLNNSLAGLRGDERKKIQQYIDETRKFSNAKLSDIMAQIGERKALTDNLIARTQEVKEKEGFASTNNLNNVEWVKSHGKVMSEELKKREDNVKSWDSSEREARKVHIDAGASFHIPWTDDTTGQTAKPGSPRYDEWLQAKSPPTLANPKGGVIYQDLTRTKDALARVMVDAHKARAEQWDTRRAMLKAKLISPAGDDGERLEHERKAQEAEATKKASEEKKKAEAAQGIANPPPAPTRPPAQRAAPHTAPKSNLKKSDASSSEWKEVTVGGKKIKYRVK